MISVIIPTYKSPDMLYLCLQSAIIGQHNKNQIIVVVDGHYDINSAVLDHWKEAIEVLDLKQNVGLCRGTNLGVMNAKHDKVLIVNDDNVFPKNWDITLELNWVSGAIISPNQIEPYPSMFSQFHIKDLGKNISEFDLDKFWEYEKSISIEKQDGFGSTLPIFMSKLDYLKIGGWDDNYQLGMVADWDFFLKANLNSLALIRLYNLHFYHFASASTNGESRKKAERSGHEYAKYKWGGYIQHDPESNKKFID